MPETSASSALGIVTSAPELIAGDARPDVIDLSRNARNFDFLRARASIRSSSESLPGAISRETSETEFPASDMNVSS